MRDLRHRKIEENRLWARRQARFVLIALTLAAMYGVFIIIRPYLHSIILALLLAIIFAPVHRWLLKKLKGHVNIAAFLSVCIVFLLVIVPAALFVSALVHQGIETVQDVQVWLATKTEMSNQVSPRGLQNSNAPENSVTTEPENGQAADLEEAIADHAEQQEMTDLEQEEIADTEAPAEERKSFAEILNSPRFQRFASHPTMQKIGELFKRIDLTEKEFAGIIMTYSRQLLEFLTTQIVPLLRTGGTIVFGFLIMLFVMFFFFRDGEKMLQYILHLSPLSSSQEYALIERIKRVSRAIVLGTFVTAAAQAGVAMIAFLIVGIPALFWGVMLGIASLIPVFGTALVWVPAVIYLLLIGRIGAAIFLGLYCALIVGSIDNFLRPYLMGGRVDMSAVMLFFAILGGIQTFGPIGIIYGPLIFGLCAVCFYIYQLENEAFLARQDQT